MDDKSPLNERKGNVMKNNDKNVKSFERAKKTEREKRNWKKTIRAVAVKSVHSNRSAMHGENIRGKPEKSMNKNGTATRTYFMFLSINCNPPTSAPSRHLKDECSSVLRVRERPHAITRYIK